VPKPAMGNRNPHPKFPQVICKIKIVVLKKEPLSNLSVNSVAGTSLTYSLKIGGANQLDGYNWRAVAQRPRRMPKNVFQKTYLHSCHNLGGHSLVST